MRSSGVVRSLTAAATSVLLLGLVALPSTAATGEASHLEMMQAVSGEGSSSGTRTPSSTRSPSQAPTGSDMTCYDDAADDEQKDFNAPTATDEPRADILEHCVAFGATLSLSVRVATPTDPETDAGWRKATFIGWFLDTDADGHGDYFVDYSLEAGETESTLGTRVKELQDDGSEGQVTCSTALSPNYTGWHSVSHIDPSCIGDATTVQVQVAVFYEDEDGDDNFDTAPAGADTFTAPEAQVDEARDTRRLAGQNRILTSIAISQERFPGGAEHVYLARQDVFADAVAGGSLTRGAIILVPTCGTVPQAVIDEVDRLDPSTVYALGGPLAICDQVLIDAADGRRTDRLAGDDRFETAVAISKFQFADPANATEVYLARSDVFADAVAGGVLTKGQVLLVPSCGTVPAGVQAEINRLNPGTVYALGGTAAICETTFNLAAQGRSKARLAGPTRIETAIAISQHAFPQGASTVYVARATPNDKLVDSVAGGVLIDGPILLVPECGALPLSAAGEISRVGPSEVIALGGSLAVCDSMLTQAGNA